MEPYYETKLGKLYHGDVRYILPLIENIQSCITSPPYWGLRDYGNENQIGLEKTPEAYTAELTKVFNGVKKSLNGDGTLWLNLGDSYAGSGKGQWGDGENDPKKNKTRGMVLEHGFTPKGLKPKDLVGIPWRVAFSLQSDGWYLRQDIIWHKPNPMPESVKDRCTKSHEYIFLMSKNGKYYYDTDAISEEATTVPHAPGWANSVSTRNDRSPENESNKRVWGGKSKYSGTKMGGGGTSFLGHSGHYKANGELINPNGTRNKRSVWSVITKPYSEAHFATFPTKLIEPCIFAGSREGDTVLDPFFGAGTTGLVCEQYNRKWIGIEISEKYCEIAAKRIESEASQLKLWG